MIGIVNSAAILGFMAEKVFVEVDICRGLPQFFLVGLLENSVKEARVRVQSAIINSGLDFPKAKISVNLAPADLKKDGTSFDLAIALGILMASGLIPKEKITNIGFVAELSLAGDLKPVRGMLAIAECLQKEGCHTLIVAKENAEEASLIKDINVKIADNLNELVSHILADDLEKLPSINTTPFSVEDFSVDMKDVVGQEEAKRALLIAAAGDHNLLLVGGPGSGKSMMAHRIPSILPPLSYEESILVTRVYSIAGLTMAGKLIRSRPFRAPHHTTTKAGLIGGGSNFIRPGEVSLACNGVLFLDELLEFPKTVLEVLRQPLETGHITIGRAYKNVTYPANISLIGALNPCPCGYLGQTKKNCTCSPITINRYQSRLSGPFLDRMDLQVQVPAVDLRLMANDFEGESSKSMQERVIKVREIQKKRLGQNKTNGKMSRKEIKVFAKLNKEAENFFLGALEKLSLSARSFDRILRVSRTIADLENSAHIHKHHVAEAFSYRGMDLNDKRR